MLKRAYCPVTATMWGLAVVGAGGVLVGPITPWVALVEGVGGATCALASFLLFAWYFRGR